MVPQNCAIPLNDTIGSHTVLKLLMTIKVHRTTGPEDIPGLVLRNHAFTLAQTICTIFNASIRNKTV